MKIIKTQIEANYVNESNNCGWVETIFELMDGRLFAGQRQSYCHNHFHDCHSQNQKTFRKEFLTWLKETAGEYENIHETPFTEVYQVKFAYN